MRPFLLAVVLLAGCASPRAALVHLETKDIRICADQGVLYAAALAKRNVASCAREYERLGYTRAALLTETQRKALSPVLKRLPEDANLREAPKSILGALMESLFPFLYR